LRQAAKAAGMRMLVDDGKLKVMNGITTLSEVATTAQVEGVVD
jgi:type IV pilus assembly protein PilB